MSSDQITADVSARICAHMNGDHAEAVIDYARYYGGIEAPKNSQDDCHYPGINKA